MNTTDAPFAALAVFSITIGNISWTKNIGIASYSIMKNKASYCKFPYLGMALFGSLMLSEVIAVLVSIGPNGRIKSRLRWLFLPNMVMHICVIFFAIGHCTNLIMASESVEWYFHITSLFPFIAWHICSAKIVYLYFKEVASYNLLSTGLTYGELRETYDNNEAISDQAWWSILIVE